MASCCIFYAVVYEWFGVAKNCRNCSHIFCLFGTKINIVQTREVLIPGEDEEISRKFTEIFSKKYNVYLGYETTFVTKENNNNNNSSKFRVMLKTPLEIK